MFQCHLVMFTLLSPSCCQTMAIAMAFTTKDLDHPTELRDATTSQTDDDEHWTMACRNPSELTTWVRSLSNRSV